jgi:O-antigen/teichoic acid export membrane protein
MPKHVSAPNSTLRKLAPGELTHIATRGAFWNIGLAAGNKIFTMVGQLILAWILSPKDMGLAGMAIAMAGIVAFMNAYGVSDVLIQRGRYKEEAGQGLWLSLFLSLCTSTFVACLAPIASWMGHPELSKMFLILFLLPIADALSPVLSAALKSDLNFKYFAICTFFGGITYTIFAVLFAWWGLGAYSLILPSIPRALVNWALMLPKTGLPRFEKPRFSFIKKLIRPSLSISLMGFLTALQQQAPVFCVGLVTDFTVTGHFSWGWQVASQAVFLLAVNLRQVLMPTLSKINHDPERQASAMFRAIRAITALLTIACGLQALLAQPLLNKFFPMKWNASGPVITWISLGLIFQGIYVCLSSWLNAAGRYRELLSVTILPVLLSSAGAYFGAIHAGSEGAACGAALGFFISMMISLKVIPLSILKEQLLRFLLPLIISLSAWTIFFCLNSGDSHNFGQSVVFSFFFLCISALSWWYWSRGMFNKFLETFFHKNFLEFQKNEIPKLGKSNNPNFFIIGAPKCGTTALSEYLKDHPNVFMSHIKEPDYFDFDLARLTKMRAKTYFSLFSDANPKVHKAIGEASTHYLFSDCAVAEILKFNPEAKFIVMLRNPVDLVQSLHSQMLFEGKENISDFETAWRSEGERKKGKNVPFSCWEIKQLMYSDWGKLGEQVERLFLSASKAKVKIILQEDFAAKTKKEYEEVLKFLNVPPDGRQVFPRINEHKHVRLSWLQQFFGYLALNAWITKKKLGIKRKFNLISNLLLLNSESATRDEISEKFRSELCDFFHDDVMKLSKILKRDLSHWVTK